MIFISILLIASYFKRQLTASLLAVTQIIAFALKLKANSDFLRELI